MLFFNSFNVITLLFFITLQYESGASIFSWKKKLSPVIFVPGYGGNQVEAKLHKSSSPYFFCENEADWYNLWLNLDLIAPLAVYCWVDNTKLHYDNNTRTTHNTPGVEIRIPGWGSPGVIEWFDPTHNIKGAYFKDIANVLIDLGYERKKNIRGAPYDFRKAPNELNQWFIDTKKLVEDTYERNEQTPVTLITHSMGSTMALVFLQGQSSEWKRQYIRRQISLAGAWAGSMKALKVFAMGDDLDSFFLSAKTMKEEQISNPSTAWLLPSPLFWRSNEVLVETPRRKYTMSQLESFFNDIDYRIGWEKRKDTLRYTLNFSPPDVELHCIYGDGINTVEKLHYDKDATADAVPTLILGGGDGTVNRRSLQACKHWLGYQQANISTLSLTGVGHMSILANKNVLDYIKKIMQT